MSAPYRFVRDTGLYKAFLAFCRRTLVRWIPSSIARVGVSVGVKPDGHWRLLLLCWIGSRPGFCPATDSSPPGTQRERSEEHTSELQSRQYLVCRLLLEKKKTL